MCLEPWSGVFSFHRAEVITSISVVLNPSCWMIPLRVSDRAAAADVKFIKCFCSCCCCCCCCCCFGGGGGGSVYDYPSIWKQTAGKIRRTGPSNCMSAILSNIYVAHLRQVCHNNVWPRARARVCVYVCRFCNVWVYCNMYTTTLTWIFPCFFLSCKANAKVEFAKTGHAPHSSKLVVICVVLLLFVLFCCYLCRSVYCLCVNVYCTTATGCQPNCI